MAHYVPVETRRRGPEGQQVGTPRPQPQQVQPSVQGARPPPHTQVQVQVVKREPLQENKTKTNKLWIH